MPFKDRLKQLRYMRKYQSEKRGEFRKYTVLRQAEEEMIKIARESLIARHIFTLEQIPNIPTVKFDRPQDLKVPIIHTEFMLGDSESLYKATMKLVEGEDTLLLVGEHKGYPALGIHGLATAPERNIIEGKGTWTRDIIEATHRLKEYKHPPPYAMIVNASHKKRFPTSALHDLSESMQLQCYFSPYLCDDQGRQNNALVVKPSKNHFKALLGADLTIQQLTNSRCKIWEAIAPYIREPTAICEIREIPYLPY